MACVMLAVGPMLVYGESTSHIGNPTFRAIGFVLAAIGFMILTLAAPPDGPGLTSIQSSHLKSASGRKSTHHQ